MFYRPFHQFGQAKFPDSGSILGLSQFSILAQLPLNTMLGLKVVEIHSKISNSVCMGVRSQKTYYFGRPGGVKGPLLPSPAHAHVGL